jgi:hypothetical protein
MKKANTTAHDELRTEYDLTTMRVRKLGPKRKSFGDLVRLEPDVAKVFADADAVNEALRSLIRSKPKSKQTVPRPEVVA